MEHPTYHLVAHGLSTEPARVIAFRAREAMSDAYEVTIECLADASKDLGAELLGRRATLLMNVSDPPEVFHGVIHSVGLVGHTRTTDASGEPTNLASWSIKMGPRFWLLKKRRRSRVFQGKRVDEIVESILAGSSIPTLWALQHELPVREYCTQYEETDEEFIRRILAEAGIMFYFLQPALPPALAGVGAIIDAVLGALKSIPFASGFLDNLGVGSITGEVMLFSDDPITYYGIGDMPEGLEGLIQSALGRATSEVAKATGEVGAAVTSAVRDVAAFGISAAGTSRELHYRGAGDALVTGNRDVVQKFSITHSMESDAVMYSTFDPRRPNSPLTFTAAGDAPLGQIAGLLGALPGDAGAAIGTAAGIVATGAKIAGAAGLDTGPVGEALGAVGAIAKQLGMAVGEAELTVYDHHDPFLLPDWEHAKTEARRILAGERRDRRLARGESLSPLLSCGRRFTLVDHPVEWTNREYVVTEVVHEGRSFAHVAADDSIAVYKNSFACVPSDVPYLPRRPRRRTIQTCHTATVITPAANADIETRGMGEIKVRFHWEQGQTGTCWVRTMQGWGGVGFGTQFMPRAGMEVVVGFDGGDPDRPIVLGCVYNAIHPPPFLLPQEQTKSGIRTQSTPGGEGSNELSFEDRQGAERVYLHAERDLDVAVDHDRHATVLHDDALDVEHDQHLHVKGAQEVKIDAGQSIVVKKHRRLEVEGGDEHITRGHRQETIIGSYTSEVRGTHRSSYGGAAGESIEGDFTRQTRGCSTELVARSRVVRVEGASESSSGDTNQLHSDKEVLIRCGDSTIRVASDCIELTAKRITLAAEGSSVSLASGKISQLADGTWQAIADKALVVSSGASVGLSSEAKVDGSKILLNSAEQADDSIEQEEIEPTIIELKDQDGHPVPNERYRIELGDGTARTGNLDADGRAEVRIEGSGANIVFPDLAEVEAS